MLQQMELMNTALSVEAMASRAHAVPVASDRRFSLNQQSQSSKEEEEDSFDATPDFGAVRVSEGGAAKSLSSAFSLRKRQSWSPGLPKGI